MSEPDAEAGPAGSDAGPGAEVGVGGRALRLGVFGGMFDPPHVGHIAFVRAALDAGVCDRVLVVPAGPNPAHRAPPLGSPAARLQLAHTVFDALPGVEVSDIEVRRGLAGGSSYMYDTLREIARDRRDARLLVLLGADQVLWFERWHRWREVLQLASLAVARRAGTDDSGEALDAVVDRLRSAGGRVTTFAMQPVTASSTKVRELLLLGQHEAARAMLPPGVDDLLEQAYGQLLA